MTSQNTLEKKDNTTQRALWRASSIAAGLAAFLAVSKLALYWQSASLIVALSAFDSAIDVLVSLVNRRVIRFARQDADSDHPYGHGRAESIAALGQGALIAGAAITIFSSSAKEIYAHTQGSLAHASASLFLIMFFFFAAAVSVVITLILKHFGTRYNSPALHADSEHYRSDVLSNIGNALAVSAVLLFDKPILDPIIAGLMALYIAWSGFRLLKTTVDDLMDHDISQDIKSKALALIISTNDKIIDVHRFRGRRSGHRLFFDFHVTLPDDMQFKETHEIADKIETTLADAFDADVVVHVDPASTPISNHLALSRRHTDNHAHYYPQT